MLINFYVVDDIKAFSTLKMDGSTLFSRYFLLISVVLFVCFTERSKALLIPTYVTHTKYTKYNTTHMEVLNGIIYFAKIY